MRAWGISSAEYDHLINENIEQILEFAPIRSQNKLQNLSLNHQRRLAKPQISTDGYLISANETSSTMPLDGIVNTGNYGKEN